MLSRKALRMLYFPYVHFVISCGIIVVGNTTNNIKIFRMQTYILRIMTNSMKVDSCREKCKIMEILPFYSQYIFSLLLCVVSNKHLFTKNIEGHNHDIRSANNFHLPFTSITKQQKGVHFAGIKFFHLATCIMCVAK